LVETHEGNRGFGRLRRRWEVNIKIDLKKRAQYELISSDSCQGPVAGSYEHASEYLDVFNFSKSFRCLMLDPQIIASLASLSTSFYFSYFVS
jgi:hypothetical protein